MVVLEIKDRFIMKNFSFNNICNITQEHKNYRDTRFRACGFIGKSSVIKYHQLLSNVVSLWNRKFMFRPVSNSFLLSPSIKVFDPTCYGWFDSNWGNMPTRSWSFLSHISLPLLYLRRVVPTGAHHWELNWSWGPASSLGYTLIRKDTWHGSQGEIPTVYNIDLKCTDTHTW